MSTETKELVLVRWPATRGGVYLKPAALDSPGTFLGDWAGGKPILIRDSANIAESIRESPGGVPQSDVLMTLLGSEDGAAREIEVLAFREGAALLVVTTRRPA